MSATIFSLPSEIIAVICNDCIVGRYLKMTCRQFRDIEYNYCSLQDLKIYYAKNYKLFQELYGYSDIRDTTSRITPASRNLRMVLTKKCTSDPLPRGIDIEIILKILTCNTINRADVLKMILQNTLQPTQYFLTEALMQAEFMRITELTCIALDTIQIVCDELHEA